MRRLVLGSLTTLVLVTTGCGVSGPDGVPEGRPITGGTSSSTSPSTSSPAAGSPSTPQSTVAAATGTQLSGSLVSVNAPADFKAKALRDGSGGNVNGPDARYNLLLDDDEGVTAEEDTDYQAKLSQKASSYDPPLVRQPDVTVAGVPAYHLAGPDDGFGGWAEEFGFRLQGHTVKILVGTPADLPQTERDAMNDSILASVQVTG